MTFFVVQLSMPICTVAPVAFAVSRTESHSFAALCVLAAAVVQRSTTVTAAARRARLVRGAIWVSLLLAFARTRSRMGAT